MATSPDRDPRNIDFAQRIERILKNESKTTDETIATSVAVLNSLIDPRAAELEYKARENRLLLPKGYHCPLQDVITGADGLYHRSGIPTYQSVFQSVFRNLPEAFELPAFSISVMEKLGGNVIMVPTNEGELPNIALTPSGYLCRLRPVYYFNNAGQGLVYTGVLFHNPRDLQPRHGSTRSPYADELEKAVAITVEPQSFSTKPTPLTEKDFEFVGKIMALIENPLPLA